jgi:hypothetical protein
VRVSGVFSLFGAIIVALIIADFLNHASVTNNLISASTTESQLVAGGSA